MPYVPVTPSSMAVRQAAAAARWQVLLDNRPDLEPAIALQRTLLSLVMESAEALEEGRRPRLSLPPKYLAAKLARGVPAFAGEPIPLPVHALQTSLLRFCDALGEGGAGEAAAHIRSELDAKQMDAGSLLSASLARDEHAIRTGATHRGLAPDLLWLIAELAVSPFAHALQRTLFSSPDETLASALSAWNHGYCPACGSWPALAEVASSHRALRCSFCAAAWELNQYACVYCGDDGEAFVTAAPDVEQKGRRLELCSACGAYLKTIDVEALSPFPLLAIADLETMDLDIAAMEHRYARPPLRDFKTRPADTSKPQ